MKPLVEKLALAVKEKAEEDAARVHVAELMEDVDRVLAAESANIGADTLTDLVSRILAAQQMQTNDSELTKALKEKVSVAQAKKAAEAAARAIALKEFTAGGRLMAKVEKEYNTIDDAITAYEAASEQDTHDDAQKAKIDAALQLAQEAKTTQEQAREAAQAKYLEGSELFREERWDEAVAAFAAGMLEKVNDESVIRKLQKITKDTKVAKRRAADIESVTAQVGSTEVLFISGPPIAGQEWSSQLEGSVYGTYRGTAEMRQLLNEEMVDRRFPFFLRGDGLCLYRDLQNECWCIDNTGNDRTANGQYGRIRAAGGSLPVAPVEWEVAVGGARQAVEMTVALTVESEAAVLEVWLPQAHAAQQQLERFGKKGAISISCPPTIPADDLPGSAATRLDGEYILMGMHEGFPRYSSLDRGQPSGGLQLYHSARGAVPACWRISPKFTPDLPDCQACIETDAGAVPGGEAEWQSFADGDARTVLKVTTVELKEARIAKARDAREARHKAVRVRLATAAKKKAAAEAAAVKKIAEAQAAEEAEAEAAKRRAAFAKLAAKKKAKDEENAAARSAEATADVARRAKRKKQDEAALFAADTSAGTSTAGSRARATVHGKDAPALCPAPAAGGAKEEPAPAPPAADEAADAEDEQDWIE